MQNTIIKPQVLIVGAGPSGLMMACQLAVRGIPFRIIDKKDHPANYSGALIVQARSLEIFDQLGIATNAIAQGIIAHQVNIIFNGKKPVSLNLTDIGKGMTKFPYLLLLEQTKTEKLLIDYLLDFGHSVEREKELVRFVQLQDSVTAVIKLPDGTEETINASYLIAADGGQSLIRKQLNIPFLGKTHQLSLFVLDNKAEVDLPFNTLTFLFSENASSGIFPLTGERWRIDGTIPKTLKNKESVTFNDIRERFAERIRMNIKLNQPEWFSVFHAHQRYAKSFRDNRCFLIGDAAHVLSPVGAQGMNTGIQDACNLAWKLSLVIKGEANDSLLDTYHAERQPIAKQLIRSTDRAFRFVSSENLIAKKLRLYVAPLLLKILFPIIEKQQSISQYLFKGISQTGINYRKSSLSSLTSSGNFPIDSPKPGDRLPYILFEEDGKTVNIQDKANDARFHLLIFAPQTTAIEFSTIADEYKAILSIEIIPFNSGTTTLYKKLGIKHEGCYLIRPDLHIAFRSNQSGVTHFKQFFNQYLG